MNRSLTQEVLVKMNENNGKNVRNSIITAKSCECKS